MAQTRRPSKNRRATVPAINNEFYETMPLSLGSHYVYRDDVAGDHYGTDNQPQTTDYDATIRRVAVITLLVSAAVAIIVGYLFVQGLSAIRDSLPAGSPTTGSLEL